MPFFFLSTKFCYLTIFSHSYFPQDKKWACNSYKNKRRATKHKAFKQKWHLLSGNEKDLWYAFLLLQTWNFWENFSRLEHWNLRQLPLCDIFFRILSPWLQIQTCHVEVLNILNSVTEKSKRQSSKHGICKLEASFHIPTGCRNKKWSRLEMVSLKNQSFPLADNDDRICGHQLLVWCLSKTHNHQINYSDRKRRLVVETKNSIRCSSQFCGFFTISDSPSSFCREIGWNDLIELH